MTKISIKICMLQTQMSQNCQNQTNLGKWKWKHAHSNTHSSQAALQFSFHKVVDQSPLLVANLKRRKKSLPLIYKRGKKSVVYQVTLITSLITSAFSLLEIKREKSTFILFPICETGLLQLKSELIFIPFTSEITLGGLITFAPQCWGGCVSVCFIGGESLILFLSLLTRSWD